MEAHFLDTDIIYAFILILCARSMPVLFCELKGVKTRAYHLEEPDCGCTGNAAKGPTLCLQNVSFTRIGLGLLLIQL